MVDTLANSTMVEYIIMAVIMLVLIPAYAKFRSNRFSFFEWSVYAVSMVLIFVVFHIVLKWF